jgi:hypothetical protein
MFDETKPSILLRHTDLMLVLIALLVPVVAMPSMLGV